MKPSTEPPEGTVLSSHSVGTGEERIDVDLLEPSLVRGTIVYLHGGAWIMGSRRDHRARLLALADQGMRVVSIDYRLAHMAPWPAQQNDMQHVIQWLQRRGQVSSSRDVVLMGASAGAHLATLAGLSMDDAPAGVVGLFGRYDLTPAASSVPEPTGEVPQEVRSAVPPPGFDGHTPELRAALLCGVAVGEVRPEDLVRVSPVSHLHASSPPLLLLHGQEDAVTHFGHSIHMADAARIAGAWCEVVLVPRANHEDERFDLPSYASMVAAFVTRVILERTTTEGGPTWTPM